MNIVVSDPKTRKAYSKKIDNPAIFLNRKIGDKVELGLAGLDGYEAEITGGSDKEGFPMKHDLTGGNRRDVYVVTNVKQGSREKITRRGNLVTQEISQLNLKVTKEGAKKLDELLGGEKKDRKEQISVKEQMVKESLENVGKISAEEAKLIKKSR